MSRTIDPGFDPRIADWLEADPDTAPREVMQVVESALPSIPQRRAFRPPWRTTPMNRFIPIAIASVLLAAVAGGVALLSAAPRPVAPPTAAPSLPASPAPSTAPGASSLAINLARTFTSPLYGYTIGTDPAWPIANATLLADDPRGTEQTSSDLITIPGTDTQVGVLVWNLKGKPFAAWLDQYHREVSGTVPPGCDGGDPATWPAIAIGDHQGSWMQLCNAAAALVNVGDWVYVFSWGNSTFNAGQHLPPSDFKKMLRTVTLPASATSDAVPSTFTSPLYGYSIGMAGDWMAKAATKLADDPTSTEENAMDAITITGTDTTIGGLAWTLGDQTYDEWAAAYHDDAVAGLPKGCDGGDPSTWPTVQVGDQQGHWLQKCNAAEAIVPVDGKVYVFSWGNSTLDSGSHLDPLDFKTVLLTVTFPDAAPSPAP